MPILCLDLSCVFFKQKTAYEMRISDWSSDVCSSDLLLCLTGLGLLAWLFVAPLITHIRDMRAIMRSARRASARGFASRSFRILLGIEGNESYGEEMGRSEERRCRERVCQSV